MIRLHARAVLDPAPEQTLAAQRRVTDIDEFADQQAELDAGETFLVCLDVVANIAHGGGRASRVAAALLPGLTFYTHPDATHANQLHAYEIVRICSEPIARGLAQHGIHIDESALLSVPIELSLDRDLPRVPPAPSQ